MFTEKKRKSRSSQKVGFINLLFSHKRVIVVFLLVFLLLFLSLKQGFLKIFQQIQYPWMCLDVAFAGSLWHYYSKERIVVNNECIGFDIHVSIIFPQNILLQT